MVHREYLCKVRVAYEYNIVKGYKDFTVDMISDDQDIIRQYCNVATVSLKAADSIDVIMYETITYSLNFVKNIKHDLQVGL